MPTRIFTEESQELLTKLDNWLLEKNIQPDQYEHWFARDPVDVEKSDFYTGRSLYAAYSFHDPKIAMLFKLSWG